MKKLIPTILLSFLCLLVTAQPTNERGWYERADIENVDIGWMKKLEFKTPAKPFVQNGWSYPVKQTEISQKLTSWLQETYLPKGLLGELKQSVYAPEIPEQATSKSYNFNEAEKNNRNALPNTYGAIAVMDALVVKTAKAKFVPMYGNRATRTWNIMANNLQLISNQQIALSSPDEYYCIMPKYIIGMKGEFDKEWMPSYAQYRDFTSSPALKDFEHYFIPGKVLGADAGYYVIIMTKDKQPLPLEQVTIGEFINRLEKQFPLLYKIQLNSGSKDIDLMARAKRGFGYLKDQYKNRLNEYAYFSPNTHIDLFSFTDMPPGKDFPWLKTQAVVQENRDYTTTYFPLLRLKKGVKESLANSGPQWIVFRLDLAITMANEGEVHLMDNFVSNFNYDYVYNYFFGKDKVITPYKPVGFISRDAKNNSQKATELSALAQKMAADKSVHYFEDFSTTPTASVPANWTTQRSENTGDKVAVVEVKNATGKWLRLKRYAVPNNISLPLTGDFTISFDILVQKGDVPWGTPGMQLQLYSGRVPAGEPGYKATDKTPSYSFSIDVSPGNMNQANAAGWVMIGQVLPEDYNQCKRQSYYSLPDFTGNKDINTVTMAIQRKGESVTVLCNNKKVYSCDKTFPPDLSFKNLRFYVNEKNVYHISNIMIKKP